MFDQTVTPERLQTARLEGTANSGEQPVSSDPFIEHYFRRIDPRLAASFTPEQREAIKTMFGARGIAQHTLEVRRSIPIGRRRFYLVVLFGRERRTFGRLYSDGSISRSFNLLGYAITAALWMVPAAAAALLLQAIF